MPNGEKEAAKAVRIGGQWRRVMLLDAEAALERKMVMRGQVPSGKGEKVSVGMLP